MRNTYTDRMKAVLERVTAKGSADKFTMAEIASIIWEIDQRLAALEEEVSVDDKPAPVPAPKKKGKVQKAMVASADDVMGTKK